MTNAEIAVEQLDDHNIQVTLPGELTIAASSALHESLAGIVESTNVIVLNATRVEKVDTAGVQLLAAFAHERSDQALLTELRHRPERLASALDMLGLASCFS